MPSSIDKKIIDNPKYISKLFWLCWTAYAAAYLGRLNFAAAMAEIIAQGHLSAAQAGLIVTAFFISYGVGQLINGFAGDRFRPELMMFAGLVISAIANIIMGLSMPASVMVYIWAVNGFAQAMMWPAVVKLVSTRLSRNNGIKAMVNISTTVPAGTLAAYVTAAGIIAFSSWNLVFLTAAVIMGVMAVIWIFGIGRIERHVKKYGKSKVDETKEDASIKTETKVSFPRLILMSGLPLAVFAVILQGMIRDGVTAWTPALINDRFNLGVSLSVLVTTLVPLVSILGVYASNILNRKFIKNEVLTAGVLFIISAVSFVFLAIWGSDNIMILLFSLAAAISVMHGVNTMLISMVPLYFADSGKSATVTGTMNAFTYLGSGISALTIGIITSQRGWDYAIIFWIAIAALGTAVCLICAGIWARFKNLTGS